MQKVGQIIINYFKDKQLLNIKADGWKLGEEKLLIAVLEQTAKYFESNRFRNAILKAVFNKVKK